MTTIRIQHDISAKMLFLVILGFAILTGIAAAGSADLRIISLAQRSGIHEWLVFHDPFNMFACTLALLAIQGLAKQHLRATETLAGNLKAFNLPEQGLLFILCALATALWLGAWYDPFGAVAALETRSPIAAAALGVIVFLMKAFLLTWLQNHVHRNLPRYGIDELLNLGFKILMPAAAFNLLAAAAYLWLTEPLAKFQSVIEFLLLIVGGVLALATVTFILYAGRVRSRESGEQASA